MTAAADDLLAIAQKHGCSVVDEWGKSQVTLPGNIDLAVLRDSARKSELRLVARLGGGLEEFQLSDTPLGGGVADGVARYGRTATDERAIRAAQSGWQLADVLADQLLEIDVAVLKPNWCRTLDVLEDQVRTNFLIVLDRMTSDKVQAGVHSLALSINEAAETQVRSPRTQRPSEPGDSQRLWDSVGLLGDISAWRAIAAGERREDHDLKLVLIGDTPIETNLEIERSGGGLELLRWTTATSDANRIEALNHVLRFVTATSSELPRAQSVVALAERHRIALSRENAAEVQRAIADGRDQTRNQLSAAHKDLTSYVEDTSKSVQATVIGSIGVVALVARNAGLLPWGLLVLVAVVAIAGLVASVLGRWKRLAEIEQSVQLLRDTLQNDPLLPASDRDEYLGRITDFDLKGKTKSARITLVVLTALAVVVICSATGWLVDTDGSSGSETTTTTTIPD